VSFEERLVFIGERLEFHPFQKFEKEDITAIARRRFESSSHHHHYQLLPTTPSSQGGGSNL